MIKQCFNCKKDVSEFAVKCPNCGAELNFAYISEENLPSGQVCTRRKRDYLFIVSFILLIISVVYFFTLNTLLFGFASDIKALYLCSAALALFWMYKNKVLDLRKLTGKNIAVIVCGVVIFAAFRFGLRYAYYKLILGSIPDYVLMTSFTASAVISFALWAICLELFIFQLRYINRQKKA